MTSPLPTSSELFLRVHVMWLQECEKRGTRTVSSSLRRPCSVGLELDYHDGTWWPSMRHLIDDLTCRYQTLTLSPYIYPTINISSSRRNRCLRVWKLFQSCWTERRGDERSDGVSYNNYQICTSYRSKKLGRGPCRYQHFNCSSQACRRLGRCPVSIRIVLSRTPDSFSC